MTTTQFSFTGAYQFQDGTVHLGHRFYDTTTLNFTQPDPSRQELNNYAYAMGDPLNNTDPTGLLSSQCLAENVLHGMWSSAVVGGGVGLYTGFTAGSLFGPTGTLVGTLGGAAVGATAGFCTGAAGGLLTGVATC